MHQRLTAKGFTSDIADMVLQQLIDGGYLSDARYAEAFIRMRMQRGDALWLAVAKAGQRGIEEWALGDAAGKAEVAYDAIGHCRDVLARRDPQGLRFEDQAVWRRQARYLRNKGYEAATILRAMKMRTAEERHDSEDK
jgi:regulatory protein